MDEDLELTYSEKQIYNTYLSISRKANNQPFKYRKNFDNLDQDIIYTLKRLDTFFSEFEGIDIEEFFKAPFVLYEDEKYYSIHFYTKQKAVRAYTQLQTVLATADPDSKYIMAKFVESLKFLKNFCNKQGIHIDDYLAYKEDGSKIESFLIHLKHRKISFYTICGLTTSGSGVKSDSVDLLYPNFYELLSLCRGKYMRSEKLKVLAKKGINKLK